MGDAHGAKLAPSSEQRHPLTSARFAPKLKVAWSSGARTAGPASTVVSGWGRVDSARSSTPRFAPSARSSTYAIEAAPSAEARTTGLQIDGSAPLVSLTATPATVYARTANSFAGATSARAISSTDACGNGNVTRNVGRHGANRNVGALSGTESSRNGCPVHSVPRCTSAAV